MLRRFRVFYAMLCLPATCPSSYRGHRAIRTIAVSTVTSAVKRFNSPLDVADGVVNISACVLVCIVVPKINKNKKLRDVATDSSRALAGDQSAQAWTCRGLTLLSPLLAGRS